MENLIFKTIQDAVSKFDFLALIKIAVVIAISVAVYIALAVIHKKLKKRLPVTDDIKRFHHYTTVFRVLRALVIVFVIIAILQILGFNMSGFVAVFGIVAVLLALALKDSFEDIFMGLTIMMDKYFAVGDAVTFDGRDGVVVSFTIRTTKIEYLDDHSVISVANRNISKICKLTHLVDIDLPLPYELDRKRAFNVLSEICGEIAKVEGVESCELKGTQMFADSAVIYKLRLFCEPMNRPDIKREANKLIQDGLARENINIPYNQIDVHSK